MDKNGIDSLWVGRYAPRLRWSVQYKTEPKAAQTGNAFIETISVDTKDKPGCVLTCLAQKYVIYIPPKQEIIVLDTHRLKVHVAKWEDRYGTVLAPNKTYTTHGIAVPLGRIREIAEDVMYCGPQQTMDFIAPSETVSEYDPRDTCKRCGNTVNRCTCRKHPEDRDDPQAPDEPEINNE